MCYVAIVPLVDFAECFLVFCGMALFVEFIFPLLGNQEVLGISFDYRTKIGRCFQILQAMILDARVARVCNYS